jgi:hypothetical protein
MRVRRALAALHPSAPAPSAPAGSPARSPAGFRLGSLRPGPTAGLALAALLAGAFGACSSSTTSPSPAASTPDSVPSAPSVRLYLLSSAAGAIEPCGCSKDQLGGIDHLAALLAKERSDAPNQLLLGAGPLLFQDPILGADERSQDEKKAETMAKSLGKLGLTAWAPAANDWAAGGPFLETARAASGASFVAANLTGAPGFVASKLVDVGGTKVGIVGLSDPAAGMGKAPDGITILPAKDALKKELAELTAKGAQILVAAASLPRGDALRLVDEVPELHVLLIGKPLQKGDANDKQKPATLIGTTLVVEPSNHLQTVAVVDLHLREKTGASTVFADAGGVARAEELVSVSERIRELEAKLNGWETDKRIVKADVAARRADLDALRAEQRKLSTNGAAPSGSFFRYRVAEIRDALGVDADISQVLLGYYKHVNDHNKVAFADRKPVPAEKGKAGYVGVEACTECHAEERKVWDASPHAKAYETLQAKFVEYNLECVSCHVTGYGKPGGSTVTHVEKLEDVGCEVCHGPGSLHVASPEKKELIVRRPDPQGCVSECHHPPHVEGFDPVAKLQHVLGPGHGL